MKTTILTLVLASIAGLMYCSDESLAVTQEPEDQELRVLLESRRDTLKQATEILFARYRSGDADIYSLTRLNAEMLEAELLLAESTESRIKLLEESLTLYKQVEALAENRMSSGQGTQLDVVLSKADRIKIEIELYKAKKAK